MFFALVLATTDKKVSLQPHFCWLFGSLFKPQKLEEEFLKYFFFSVFIRRRLPLHCTSILWRSGFSGEKKGKRV
jgi:hypothetical protein